MDSDAVTQALLAHANTPCKTLGLSPAQLAYRITLKDFSPRNVETLTPIPENLLSADAKEQRQMKIRVEAGKRLDLHTKVLKELEVGDHVQIQNLRGRHPLKSDQVGVVTAKNGYSNYSFKMSGSGLVTKHNQAMLRKVEPTVQTEN